LRTKALYHFAEIVRHKSFTRAADELGISQPALTHMVKELESQCGTRLLERGRHGATPTALGVILARHGTAIAQVRDRARTQAETFARGGVHRLRIGGTPTAISAIVPEIVRAYGIDELVDVISLREGSTAELLALLEEDLIDLCLAPPRVDGSISWPIEAVSLMSDRLGVLCRRGHPLLSEAHVNGGHLSRYSWIMPPEGGLLRVLAITSLEDLGVARVAIRVESHTVNSVLAFLSATDHLTVLPRRILDAPIVARQISALPVELPNAIMPILIYRRVDLDAPKIIELFIEAAFSFAGRCR
jgi:DNA-binding transcriptional LysR family regulator